MYAKKTLWEHLTLTAGVRHVSVKHIAQVQGRKMGRLYRGPAKPVQSWLEAREHAPHSQQLPEPTE